jgi:hypothetical protein
LPILTGGAVDQPLRLRTMREANACHDPSPPRFLGWLSSRWFRDLEALAIFQLSFPILFSLFSHTQDLYYLISFFFFS